MASPTTDLLIDYLDRMLGVNTDFLPTSCSECKDLVRVYQERIDVTRQKEEKYNIVLAETSDERNIDRLVAFAVCSATKLETATARRFILHLIKDHN